MNVETARALVALESWEWREGMRARHIEAGPPDRIVIGVDGERIFLHGLNAREWGDAWMPVLDDAATVGCIEAMVRERSPLVLLAGSPDRWYVMRHPDTWTVGDAPVVRKPGTPVVRYPTPGEAWARALIEVSS